MSIDITIIDNSDGVGKFAAAVRSDELRMTDVQSMVNTVISHVQSRRSKIRCLSILDHGGVTGFRVGPGFRASFQVGSDRIDPQNLASFKTEFSRLAPHFHPTDGHVWLMNCQVGQDLRLLLRLARIMRVPVYAGKNLQNPVFGLNVPARRIGPVSFNGVQYGPYWVGDLNPGRLSEWEQYVRVDPDGTYRECMRPALDNLLIRAERISLYARLKLRQATISFWE